MHKLVSFVVIAVWAVILFSIVRDGAVAQVGRASQAGPGIVRESWMGIHLEDNKVGYARYGVDEDMGGYRVTEEVHAALTVLGTSQAMHVNTVSELDRGMTLRGFEFSLKSGLADMNIRGSVQGSVINARVTSAGRENAVEIPVRGPVHLASDLELVLEKEGLTVGKKLRMPFFDPSSLSEQYMDIEVEAEEEMKLGGSVIPVFRVRQEYAGITATSWVNPELGTIKAEGVMGFTFLMETREQAMKSPEGGYGSADIIALASIPAEGGPDNPAGTGFIKAGLSGASLDGFELAGGRQTFDGGVVTVVCENIDGFSPAGIPYTGDGMQAYLGATAFVQSDDPKVAAKAAEVIGGERDALKAAMRLADWVFKAVDKRPSAGIPSAVEVLEGLQGDCNEHTVLFTALARSAGIPARMDAGIVMIGDRFYYHAWPEVYVGEWVSIDPTLGQFPADATHIRFVEGGPEKQVAIIKLIGNLKVNIIAHG